MQFTAGLQALNFPPRVALQVTEAAGQQITITRYNADNTSYVVREADDEPLIGGGLSTFDYDAPHTVAATYRATTDGGDDVSVEVGTFRALGVVGVYLIHPGVPSLSMKVQGAGRGNRTRGASRGEQAVPGSPVSIWASAGKRRAASYDLEVYTKSLDEDARMAALLDDECPLLVQLSSPETERAEYAWMSIGDVDEADVVEWLGSEWLKWTLPCNPTARPVGGLQSQRTYADSVAEFSSYAESNQVWATYGDRLLDFRIGAD